MRLMAMGAAPNRGFMMAAGAPSFGPPSPGAPAGALGAVQSAVARVAGVAADAVGATGPRAQLRSVREIAGVEARRLRESAGLPGYERRDLLADLASRLAALVGHLASLGTPESWYPSLRRLVTTLGAGGDLEAVWAEAVRVLDAFAADAPAPGPADAPGPGPADPPAPGPADVQGAAADRRRTFWKR
jgi:Ca-activated chloride channel family protein